MSEESEQTFGNDVVAVVTFFILGLAVPLLFRGVVQGEDFVPFLLIFGGFGSCVALSEYYLTLTSGTALGAGLIATSLVSFDWWFAGLSVAATLLNLGHYATSSYQGLGLNSEEDTLEPEEQNHFT